MARQIVLPLAKTMESGLTNNLWRLRRKLRSAFQAVTLLLHEGRFRHSRFGPKMRVRRRDYTRRLALLREGPGIEQYEDVFAEVDGLQPSMAFVDVGANAGLFTLVASTRVGKDGLVIAFEPSKALFKELIDNLFENRASNVVPINAALGLCDGIVRFADGPETHSGIASVSSNGSAACAQFRFDSLWDSVKALLGERGIMMKMDIEGAEVQALRGMESLLSDRKLETVIVEVNDAHLSHFSNNSLELYEIFQRHGFGYRLGLGHADHYNEVFSRVG